MDTIRISETGLFRFRNFSIVVLLCLGTLANAQLVTLTLMGRDSRTGMQVRPEFKVKSRNNDTFLNVTTTNNYQVVKVQQGDEVIVSTHLDGYYPDEKIIEVDENFDEEGQTVVFELDPQPAAALSFDVKDKINGKKVAATLTFVNQNEVIKIVDAVEENNLQNIILTLPGIYSIKVEAIGYETQTLEKTVEVSNPPVNMSSVVELVRENTLLRFSIVDGQTKRRIDDANVRITNGRKVVKNDKKSGGEFEIEGNGAKQLQVEVQVEGYLPFEQIITVDKKQIEIGLDREPEINISIANAETGALMAVNVVITTPDEKTITLKSTTDKPFVFSPEQKGVYRFKISKGGFTSDETTVNISELANYQYDIKFKIRSIFQDFSIVVTDESRNILEKAKLQIFDENNEEIKIEQKLPSGEWQTKLIKDGEYNYEADYPGFELNKGKLYTASGSEIRIVLKKATVPVTIRTFDKFTKSPVATRVYYQGSEVNNSEAPAVTHNSFVMPGRELVPVFSATGYKTYKADPITNQTDAEVFLVAERYPITFKFSDMDGNVVVPDFVSIVNKSTSEPVQLSEKNVALLDAEANYYITVKKSLYAEHNSPFLPAAAITNSNSTKTVVLSPKEFIDQRFKIVNSETKELIGNPRVEVFSAEGNKYPVNSQNNLWLANLKNGENFTVSVEADGYEFFKKTFSVNTPDIEEIQLFKLKTQWQVFEAYDEILDRTVAAKFTLFDEENSKDLQTFDQGVHAKAKLLSGVKYTIRISAPDYRDKEEEFVFESSSEKPKRISFRRKQYPITIKLTTKSDKLLRSPKLNLTMDSKQVKTLYIFDKKEYRSEIETDATYNLSLYVAGFKPVVEQLKLTDISSTQLTKVIELVELPEDKVTMPADEVELPEVIVASEKKPEFVDDSTTESPTLVEVEDVYSKNKENLRELPVNDTELAATLTSDEAVGKRYILTKVYFEQSTPTMKPASDEQLNSILEVLKSNPKLKIELVGHTDNVGDVRQNQYLSSFRAKVVSNYLFNNGVDDARISVKGLGSEFPVAPNTTEENKAQNRRVELIVIEN